MGCLSKEQITRLTAGEDEDAALVSHVEQCPTCRANLSAMRSLTDRLADVHDKFNRGHELARARLLAVLAANEPRAETAKTRNRRSHFLGVLTMRQRIAVGSVGVAAMLCFLLLWGATRPVSAIARMAENIRRSKSYKATIVSEFQFAPEANKPAVTCVFRCTNYWIAPGSYRSEAKFKGVIGWADRDELDIYHTGKPGITINHMSKKFYRVPARLGKSPSLMKLEELSNYSGQADRDLGTKEIGGIRASGFEIETKKIDPDSGPGSVQVWLDPETNLPVLFRMETEQFGKPASFTMQDFQWNIDLAPELFDVTPPEGYTDATNPPPALEKQVAVLTEGLKTYAELSGGHYPRVKMVYGDVTWDEMKRMSGISGQPTQEEMRGEAFKRIERVYNFCPTINGILANNPDAAYYGKTVGPKNADKVLLRWQLEDGTYQVIFGDLRGETVTKERLGALEDGK
jgi:outer membrane lipoprotein-sorting protein